MLTELLTKSGRRVLKAIKKLSTRSRAVRKWQEQRVSHQERYVTMNNCRRASMMMSYADDPANYRLSLRPRRSIISLDARSTDTRLTDVTSAAGSTTADDECTSVRCRYCRHLDDDDDDDDDDNRTNENRENEETSLTIVRVNAAAERRFP